MKDQLDPKPHTTPAEPDTWIKASQSDSGGNCVEVNFSTSAIKVRDSKDPAGPQLTFTPAEFEAFKAGVRDGEFDR